MAILKLQGVTLGYGGPPVLDGLDLEIQRGDRLVLLGRNGAGKSTLMGVIRGLLEPDAGSIQLGAGVRVGYLEQRVPADLHGTALDVVLAGHEGFPAHSSRFDFDEQALAVGAAYYHQVARIAGRRLTEGS